MPWEARARSPRTTATLASSASASRRLTAPPTARANAPRPNTTATSPRLSPRPACTITIRGSGTRQQYDPRPATRQAYPSQPSGFPFFSGPREPAQPSYEPYYERRQARRSYDPPPRKARRYVPAAPRPEKPDKPEVAEVEPSSYVVVFGDALAELVAQGLDTAFEDADDIGVEKKVRADSGLVRPDVYDWPKAIQEYLNGGQKVTYAVVMLGSNDRQAMREGENAIDPLSDRWKEIYRQRIDDVVKVFTEKKIPLIWVGTPPVKNERASAEFLAINDLYRERVQKAGAIYVDIWPGFVDDQNRYAATGPDVEGQVVRLRSADGVYFTRAGARKAAHFADIELKRLIEQRGGTAVAAPSTDGTPAAKELDVERVISASLPALPEPQGLPSLPVRPVAGPVLPLTKPDTSPGGALASGRPRLDGDAYLVDRALREGLPRAAEARTSRRVQVAAVVETPTVRQAGNTLAPMRYSSIARAAWRPSRIAQTTSDWPRRMSPADEHLVDARCGSRGVSAATLPRGSSATPSSVEHALLHRARRSPWRGARGRP